MARQARAKEKTTASPHHTILSLEVTSGFLKGLKLDFADGLNCIIGGRGTGKTSVLELIRYALSLMPDEKVSPTRARAAKAIVQNNLSNGRVRIGVQTKHGMRYVAERAWNESTQIFNQDGEPTPISFERELIFTADVYSQNEIEEIATNQTFQLALLDKFVDEEVRRIESDVRKLQRDLDQNAGEILRLDHEIDDLSESASELSAVEEKLKALRLTSGADADAVNAAHSRRALREKERRTLEALRGDFGKAASEISALVAAHARRLETRIDETVASGSNKDVFAKISRHVDDLAAALERLGVEVVRQAQSAEKTISEQESRLASLHAKQEAEYRDLVAKLEEEDTRASERTLLQSRHSDIVAAGKDLELRDRDRREKVRQRQELTAKLSTLRDERYALRKRVAEQLNKQVQPNIRVSVTQAGNREAYRALLTETLKGQNMRYAAVVDRILPSATPEELCVFIQTGDAEGLAERVGIDKDRAMKVIDAFRGSMALYRLEIIELDDLPRIELYDGDYKDSADLSTGQRCTTILPILLLESERPLLVDQPEDNLDNRFIYETVVRNLKGAKGKRQLIFVTHNPNIPVLGDAERVFKLDSTGKQGRVSKVGTVDDLKRDIEDILEGGREAFLLRKERYGH